MELTNTYVMAGGAIAFLLLVLVLWRRTRQKGPSNAQFQEISYQLEASQADKEALLQRLTQQLSECKAVKAELAEQKTERDVLKKELEELQKQGKEAYVSHLDEDVQQKLAELELAQKKIKSLEDEVEDKEDEIDEIEKKLRKKTAECSDLESQIATTQRECQMLNQQVETLTETVAERESEISLKSSSIQFVSEILSARRVNDRNTEEFHQNINELRDFILGELRETIHQVMTYSPEAEEAIFGQNLQAWAILEKKTWLKNKTTVALVGEFSAGKTSIVNRILSQDDPNVPRLPVSSKATTAIPTYISGGDTTLYQFVTPNHEQKVLLPETFNRVTKEVLDEVKGVSSLIQYFVMRYNNPHLKNLSILDTPGFNSNDSEDAERTIGVINECDALFWVFDVNNGTVNRSSLALMREHLNRPLYVVINKIDTKAKSEVDKVEALIRKTFAEEQMPVEGFIRFSGKSPLEDIMNPILSIRRDQARENYLNTLRNSLKQDIKIWEEESRNRNGRVEEAERDTEKLNQHFRNAVYNLQRDCEAVANIPEFTSRWFREDNYQISQEDYGSMCSLLEAISSEHTQTIDQIYNYRTEAQSELIEAWEERQFALNQIGQLHRLQEQLEKYIRKIKQASKKA